MLIPLTIKDSPIGWGSHRCGVWERSNVCGVTSTSSEITSISWIILEKLNRSCALVWCQKFLDGVILHGSLAERNLMRVIVVHLFLNQDRCFSSFRCSRVAHPSANHSIPREFVSMKERKSNSCSSLVEMDILLLSIVAELHIFLQFIVVLRSLEMLVWNAGDVFDSWSIEADCPTLLQRG